MLELSHSFGFVAPSVRRSGLENCILFCDSSPGTVAIGSAMRRRKFLSEDVIGVNGSTEWRCAAADPNSTITIFFEVINDNNTPLQESGKYGIVQIRTVYTHPSGQVLVSI